MIWDPTGEEVTRKKERKKGEKKTTQLTLMHSDYGVLLTAGENVEGDMIQVSVASNFRVLLRCTLYSLKNTSESVVKDNLMTGVLQRVAYVLSLPVAVLLSIG